MQDNVIIEHDVMVAMRDGIRLACDVHRPARNGRAQPPRSRADVVAFFVQHGYVVVYQDCRGRYRDSWEAPTLMLPGMVYAIRIELFPCSNRFAAGHRVRLDIASSNFPHFDLNFNTGEAEGLSTHARIATNTVYVDQERASRVVLPIMPT